MFRVRQFVEKVVFASTLRRTMWILLSYFARFGFQATSFALVARSLGSDGFGVFSATLALTLFISPFVELGAYTLIIRDVTVKSNPRFVLGSNLSLIFVSLPIGLLVAVGIKLILLPHISMIAFLAVALAVFLGGRLQVIAAAMNVATDKAWRNSVVEIISGVLQTILAIILLLTKGSVEIWSALFLAQYLSVGIAALGWAAWDVGIETVKLASLSRGRIWEGLTFATASSASGTYAEIDKTLLIRFTDAHITGFYAAGFRVVLFAAIPLMAFLAAVSPRFFAEGSSSPRAAFAFAKRIMPYTLGLGLAASTGLWFVAPIIPVVIGIDFSDTPMVVRWMALYVLLQAFQYPLADALTASGLQTKRTVGQLAGVAVNVSLNLWLIPVYNWPGAAFSALITQLFLLVFFAVTWWHTLRCKHHR